MAGAVTASARFAASAAAIGVLMLALFGLAHALSVPVLTDTSPDLGGAGVGAASASFVLLSCDVLLPVPSSAVMVANGALFGTLGGAALSLVGATAAALLGYVLGRSGSRLLTRVAGSDACARGAALLERRGVVVIVLTRPVPVLAETVVILAGAAGMPLRKLAPAAALGSLGPAVAYALAGSVAARYGSGLIVLVGAVALTFGAWLVSGRRRAQVAG